MGGTVRAGVRILSITNAKAIKKRKQNKGLNPADCSDRKTSQLKVAEEDPQFIVR